MKFGKTIKTFLIDGEANGRMSCELSNWSGKAYKIPRIKIKDCGDREELKSTGVYMLFGKDEQGKEQVYIGEAESVLKRLGQHLTQKDFWNEAIMFISKDENLNKAHVKYLENRLHEIAKKANRYSIENAIVPTQSSISEPDRAEMEEFIEYVKMLVNTLGHKVFDEKRDITRENSTKEAQEHFYTTGLRGADAKGEPNSEGFLVFKHSKAANSMVNSIPASFITLREKLIHDAVLTDKGDYLEFSDDYIFNSPSAAATTILGRSANGLIEWKNSAGKTLKDCETV